MRNEDEIREMFKWIENYPDLGKIDVCIPNAGLNQDSKLIDGNISISLFSKLLIFPNYLKGNFDFRHHGTMENYVRC